jgi:hypothetical protein
VSKEASPRGPGFGQSPEGWSTAKYQIPSTKSQINYKFQYSMTKTGFEFRILVIVICLIFDICDLEFLFLQYFSTAKHLAIYNLPSAPCPMSCALRLMPHL